ncbi:response regulator [Microbacterium sp.]|uniref:response regulator transcription factor n=1 Tax=Microbacterium sp. TaxID=51671 RepID=UPI0039E44654
MKAAIGIVDDHPAVLAGVTAMLDGQPDVVVAGTGATVAALLRTGASFDLVLLDLVLADGSTPTGNMRRLEAVAPVLAFTSGDQPQLVRDVAQAGAVGMIRKSEPPAVLLQTVRQALAGEPVPTPDWAAALIGDSEFVRAGLSDREREVLRLYASGETAERVAEALFLSRTTVIEHVKRIRAKYGAVDRAAPTKVDLFRRAVEDGLIEPEH